MNLSLVDKIANAVLYEGYLLYLYRASSIKNRLRWNFGVLQPQAYALAQRGSEAHEMRVELLLIGNGQTSLDIRVRFLHLMERRKYRMVDAESIQTWQEAQEREVQFPIKLSDLISGTHRHLFSFPSIRIDELRQTSQGKLTISRVQKQIDGELTLRAEPLSEQLWKLSLLLSNTTPLADRYVDDRDAALLRALVSAHAIFGLQAGEFISLLEPSAQFRELAVSCKNVGCWPVLVGEDGARDTMLASPIVMYDYPQVAPESAGGDLISKSLKSLCDLCGLCG